MLVCTGLILLVIGLGWQNGDLGARLMDELLKVHLSQLPGQLLQLLLLLLQQTTTQLVIYFPCSFYCQFHFPVNSVCQLMAPTWPLVPNKQLYRFIRCLKYIFILWNCIPLHLRLFAGGIVALRRTLKIRQFTVTYILQVVKPNKGAVILGPSQGRVGSRERVM